MDNFDPEKLLKSAEKRAFKKGVFSHFDVRDKGDEYNLENVNDFLNRCFNLKIVDGVVQYVDDKGDIHELITSKV